MKLLLDTCAFIYLATGQSIKPAAAEAISNALDSDNLIVSPVTAWELGKLVARDRLRLPVDPMKFFETLVEKPGFKLCELSPEILMKSSFLPHFPHKDPMDQLFIATARILGMTLVTSDRTILAYGSAGHVKTLAC